MSPARLLEHFDRLIDTPDAVPRLRRFILDLAVRGKLVDQDPKDEPAGELLKQIQAEKSKLVKAGSIRNQEPFEPIERSEAPFEIPSTWEWVPATFPAYLISDMGKKVQTKDVLESGTFPVVDQGKVFVRGYCNDQHKVIHVDAPIILFGDHTRETKLIDFDFVVGADGVKLLHPLGVLTEFYYLALRWLPLDSRGYGRHFKLLRAATLPLPPLAEQHRIVAKVDELMALCDELEAAQTKREKRRDRLVAATLHGLNTNVVGRDGSPSRPDHPHPNTGGFGETALPATFEESASFYFKHLPRLTTRPEHIHQLRQTILNLAVRGKLVPQDPKDEPASSLLIHIQAEREQLIKSGFLKQRTRPQPLDSGNLPFEAPSGWCWTHLDDFFLSITDGDHLPPPKAETGVPFLVIGNIRNQTVDFTGCRHVQQSYYSGLDTIRRPQEGDVLYTLVGSYGIPVLLVDNRKFCVQRHIGILRPSKQISGGFLARILASGFVFAQATACATGIAQKTVPLSGLRQIVIPLPPLAEQRRIVAKVDELTRLCDELANGLASATTTSQQFLEASIWEAIAV